MELTLETKFYLFSVNHINMKQAGFAPDNICLIIHSFITVEGFVRSQSLQFISQSAMKLCVYIYFSAGT